MDKSQAQEYLSSLLNQNLRVHTTDGRLFWGAFKCTDPVRLPPHHEPRVHGIHPGSAVSAPHLQCLPSRAKLTNLRKDKNIVLANTYEYRQPSRPRLVEGPDGTTTEDRTSRYLGLVVVPGHHIVRMELEEFASQISGRQVV
ncbi:LSM domain-containing protein [Metarhizium guizhouense ARSEF 977]|uniref:LSM domain-containing protein n=1 Tax=Metarhizium guizhouense (strain ARSEF 977) TaxID=1276136 RepID=A0A0B4GR08_METGA|nr:LSM domain-containing protein [Metarhizium guizhouense ARSEF 977]